MCSLTLTYPNGTKFIVGAFSTQTAANAWLTKEQAKSSWVAGTTYVISVPSVPTKYVVK